ncbi:hypothetical protein BpHYR1_050782 [Brachionus plicatilis]|uniref:Uncharacterized protein n=1 Tax=Brachionus plicatilis TaxID=10195 RepID=A0A3M7PWB3_BRAPC|nr:hypothetical protein BpHYR1_050782 [Brachionus plicatilis]
MFQKVKKVKRARPAFQRQPSENREDKAVNHDADQKPATLGPISRNENAMKKIPFYQASQKVQIMAKQNEICQPAKKNRKTKK